MIRTELLSRLADFVPRANRSHPVRVGIDGVDAAGKTSLADELAVVLRARGRLVIRSSIEGFHNPKAFRYRRGALSPEGYYFDSFDYTNLWAALLQPLGPGGDLRYRVAVYDFRSDRPIHGEIRQASCDAVLLFDGV